MCKPEHQSGAGYEHLKSYTIGRPGCQRHRGRRHRVPHSGDRGLLVLAVFDIKTYSPLELKFQISTLKEKSEIFLIGFMMEDVKYDKRFFLKYATRSIF